MTNKIKFKKNLADSWVDEAYRSLLISNFQRQILKQIDIIVFGFHGACWISYKSISINNNLEGCLFIVVIRNMNLSENFLSYLRLNRQCFEGFWVVCDNGNSVPNILRSILLKQSNRSSVLSAKHWLD